MLTTFPQHTLILDIIHASEYLWATATALLGEISPLRTPWVASKLDLLLSGQWMQRLITEEHSQDIELLVVSFEPGGRTARIFMPSTRFSRLFQGVAS
jgi:hypothetical protein